MRINAFNNPPPQNYIFTKSENFIFAGISYPECLYSMPLSYLYFHFCDSCRKCKCVMLTLNFRLFVFNMSQ